MKYKSLSEKYLKVSYSAQSRLGVNHSSTVVFRIDFLLRSQFSEKQLI